MVSPESCASKLSKSILTHDTDAIKQYYDIGDVQNWRKNTRGLVNKTYEIDNQFFLTAYQKRSREELEAVAQIANGMDSSIPTVRPQRGRDGYSMDTVEGHALLAPRLPGQHYVGRLHTDKYPIPEALHLELATFFWKLQGGLSAAPENLKDQLRSPSRATIGKMPEQLPDIAKPLERFGPSQGIPEYRYPDLVHGDLERQNILSGDNTVTGVVDLDSIRAGDILYEYGHFLFNNVCCDPQADNSTAQVYIDTLRDSGRIDPRDIPSLYGHIYHFAVSDIVDFKDLTDNYKGDPKDIIDLELLVTQYEQALQFASDFFRPQSKSVTIFEAQT